jgi:hypothetical protein
MPSARPFAEGFGQPTRLRPHALVLQVIEPEVHGVSPQRAGDAVHVHLPNVVIGGRGQAPVRPLAQRRIGLMKLNSLRGNIVGRSDRGRTRVPVVAPGNDALVGIEPGLDVDDAGWTE